MKNNLKHSTAVLSLILILITVVIMIRTHNGADPALAYVLIVIMLLLNSIAFLDPERRQRRRRRRTPITTLLDNDKHSAEREALFLADVKNIANRSCAPNLPNVNANGGIAEAFSSDEEHGLTGALSDTASRGIDKSMPYSYMNKAPKVQQNSDTKVSLSKDNYGQKKAVNDTPRPEVDKSMPYSYMNGGSGMPDNRGMTRAADIFGQSKTSREALFLADINNIANGNGSVSKYNSYSKAGTGMSRASGRTREAQFFADINEIADRKRAQNDRRSLANGGMDAGNDINGIDDLRR